MMNTAMHRYSCIECGKGFQAKGWEETRFDKKSCKKDWVGKDWKPEMWTSRTKSMTTAEKMLFIKEQ